MSKPTLNLIQFIKSYVKFKIFLLIFLFITMSLSPFLFSEKIITSTEELTESRDANSRLWINHYEQDELDIDGNPTGEKIYTTGEIIEKGDNINYDIQDYKSNPDAEPIWFRPLQILSLQMTRIFLIKFSQAK